jgi:hypothetical protein
MKKMMVVLFVLTLAGGLFATENTGTMKPATLESWSADKTVVVYYFHFTRRCTTCNNVEKVSKEAVEALYPAQVKSGTVSFQSVNLDEKAGEAIGKKLQVEGQSLMIISGDKRVDLTDKGFMYANESPAKLKTEIRKAVDGMLQ